MTLEYTLSLIKPDITKRNLTGEICTIIEAAGFHIVAQKRILLTKKQAQAFYKEHAQKDFFEDLVAFITSAPVVAQVLEKENAIADYRALMGATDPEEALEGTIRNKYALGYRRNSVHGSDSEKSAKREIAFFFSQMEILIN